MSKDDLERYIADAMAEYVDWAVAQMHESNRRARETEWPWRLPEEDYQPNEGILDAVDKEWSEFITAEIG